MTVGLDLLGRKLWRRTDLPGRLGLWSVLASSCSDVDEVFVEKDVKGDVRHWETLSCG